MHEFDYERIRANREKMVPVEELIEVIDPQAGEVILDVGSGDGFYALKMARKSPKSKIIAIEMSAKGNNLLRNEMKKEQIENIEIIEDDVCKIKKFPEYDKVFFSIVFHDFVCKEQLIENLKLSAKKGAQFIFFEFLKDSQIGPPRQIKLSGEELMEIGKKCNLKLESEKIFKEHYVQKYLMGSP